MLLLPPPVPTERSGELAGGICLSVFPKGHLRVANLCSSPGHLLLPVPLLCWALLPGQISHRGRSTSAFIPNWPRALPLLHLPVPSHKGMCHRICLRKVSWNTNKHFLPNAALQSSWFQSLHNHSHVQPRSLCCVNPHGQPWSTAQRGHSSSLSTGTVISDRSSRGEVVH